MTIAELQASERSIDTKLIGNTEYCGTISAEEVREAIGTIHHFLAVFDADSMATRMTIDQMKQVLYWFSETIEPFAMFVEHSEKH